MKISYSNLTYTFIYRSFSCSSRRIETSSTSMLVRCWSPYLGCVLRLDSHHSLVHSGTSKLRWCNDSSIGDAVSVHTLQMDQIRKKKRQMVELDLPTSTIVATSKGSSVDTPCLQRTSKSVGKEEQDDGWNWDHWGLFGVVP